MDRYWDDLRLGESWTSAPFAVSAEEIVAFGRAYDPQPMHTDAEAAAQGRFGGLIASGWHVAALAMRAFVGTKPFGETPILGIGIDQLRWLKPVRPGDVLTARREVIDLVRSESKPDRGTIRTRATVFDQNGETVMTLEVLTQMPLRPAGA